jgi:hypothetical protein
VASVPVRRHSRITSALAALLLGAVLMGPPVFASPSTYTDGLTDRPERRASMGMAYDGAHGEVVMFGGTNGIQRLGDTWIWNGTGWTQTYPGVSPSPRCCMGMAYDAKQLEIVLFGGCCDEQGGLLDDTWTWDGTTWHQEHPATAPPPRAAFGMAFHADSGTIVIFGGEGGSATPTWTWDGTTWTEQEPAHTPQQVEGPGMTEYHGRVVMFGGEFSCYEDLCYQHKTLMWDGVDWSLRGQQTRPTERGFTGMAFDVGRKQVVLFGGEYTYAPLQDTWTWDGKQWTRQTPPDSPPSRWLLGMAYDGSTHQVVVFGGYGPNDELLGDTWTWDGTTWRHAA